MRGACASRAIFPRLTWSGVVTLIEWQACSHGLVVTKAAQAFGRTAVDFVVPADLVAYLAELDQFIAREIKPIETADDNIRFFDHRREWARTDFENGGLPRNVWEVLLRRVKNLADEAGHLRFAIPKRYGGKDGSNLWMAVIREHFASRGLGLHNDL